MGPIVRSRWFFVTVLLGFAAWGFGCGDDDDSGHHHVCDPPCEGEEICQHGGICGMSCTDPLDPTVCETYVAGEVHYCHAESGMCEPFGETCTSTDLSGCASFQICQLFANAGTCALPCQEVGGDGFCQLLDSSYICHPDAAGGICGPSCQEAGGTLDCAQLPPPQGHALVCNDAKGTCDAIAPPE